MTIVTTNEIREQFLDFFAKNGHRVVRPSSLIPHNDPSLMFTNSGMVQFKNYFTERSVPEFKRATTCQKCIRAGGKHNDLDNVGRTARHHTFFEMLGNFSFGDYFKEHAIEMAWTLLTKVLHIPAERLYITVYHTDEEAAKIWKKLTGFSEDKIIKIATDDNLWSMGATGPYGPCSEIFYDHGPQYSGGLPGTHNADGDRYVEIWNLVFMQYEKFLGGSSKELPHPSIDTGMGIERIAAVMQGVHNNFDTDILKVLITTSIELSHNDKDIVSHRIIADHIRSAAFLIADGVIPSNEKRGYVLRRIIRRAVRRVQHLGVQESMLHRLVPQLIHEMNTYHELKLAEQMITEVLKSEEEKFRSTIENGIQLLEHTVQSLPKGAMLDGALAFKLYDTYGFPIDLTKEILLTKGINVDEEQFYNAMMMQKARASWHGSNEQKEDKVWFDIRHEFSNTEFLGYVTNEVDVTVLAIIKDGIRVSLLNDGEQGIVVLDQTPFYGELGGQVGDSGRIGQHEVMDTKVFANKNIVAHYVKAHGKLEIGEQYTATIDCTRRRKIRANHSATHILNHALKNIIGMHVVQSGSFVNEQKLRFDFTHSRALTSDEIHMIEHFVNSKIISNESVSTSFMQYSEAIESGAVSLLGENYSENVRVVSIGESKELCGGTHVERTGDIGMFKIICEESVASGIRRIEACTGLAALASYQNEGDVLCAVTSLLQSNLHDIYDKITYIINEKKELTKSVEHTKMQLITSAQNAIKVELNTGDSVVFYDTSAFCLDTSYLRKIVDKTLSQHINAPTIIIAVTCNSDTKNTSVAVKVTKNATLRADTIVHTIIGKFGGRGGGNGDFAQAGGLICHDITPRAFFTQWM